MSVLVLIPARHGSTRYPGKPLEPLRGATGAAKPLIRRAWEAAAAVAGVDRIAVATDDARIAGAVEGFGAEAVMTAESCANGTERCADALARMGVSPEIVVNLQGDAPLTPPWFVEALIAALRAEPATMVATPVLRCDADALAGFHADRAAGRVGATTAVFDHAGRALYFSKEVIPFTGRALAADEKVPVWHHVGVYAYRPAALAAYCGWEAGPLERWEGLEQLRFLENGCPVRCVAVEPRGAVFWELNNPTDVARVETALAARGLV